MRVKPINSVKPGDLLGRTLYNKQGRAMLHKGAVLNGAIIKRIREHGYLSLYVQDEFNNDLDEIVRPEIRQKTINVLRESFESFDKYVKYVNSNIHVDKKIMARLRNEFAENVDNIARELVDEVLNNNDVSINIIDIKSMDNYTYQHSVNVCILSVALGIEMGLNKYQLNDLAVGALLHDIGKTLIPIEILMKPGKLTEDEFKQIQDHPRIGYDYLKRNILVCQLSKLIVCQHHERLDGTGYPQGLKGHEIHRYSKAVAICDVYDALTSDRVYKKADSPGFALEYIMSNSETQYDKELCKLFFKRVIPYPVGTRVILSTGEIAVVEELNRFLALRPIVRVLEKDVVYDLEKVNNIVIQGREIDEHLSLNVNNG